VKIAHINFRSSTVITTVVFQVTTIYKWTLIVSVYFQDYQQAGRKILSVEGNRALIIEKRLLAYFELFLL